MSKCVFNNDWINESINPGWARWLRPVPNDKFSATCVLCKKSFSLSNMGRQAVESHSTGKTHQKHIATFVDPRQVSMDYFRTSSSALAPSVSSTPDPILAALSPTPSTTPAPTSPALPSTSVESPVVTPSLAKWTTIPYLLKDSITKAEIIWAMKIVMSHYSFNSSAGISSIFQLMFPDSEIARAMEISSTKTRYSVVYGLGPYFKNRLSSDLAAADHLVVCFDEAFNRISHSKQMDLVVRYWDDVSNRVQTRYLTSIFMGHGTSEILLDKFKEGLCTISVLKVLQISMDGLNVNWKFLDLFNREINEIDNDSGQPLEIGSCGLHVIHGAVGTGIKQFDWRVKSLLNGAYCIFKDSPARRSDYLEITGSSVYPLKFCQHRWVKNVFVINRIIAIYGNLQKYIRATPQKPCECESLTTVRECLANKLMMPQLEFTRTIFSTVEPFLCNFQSSKPLAPFFHGQLELILRSLMGRFVKPAVLDAAKSIITVDLDNKNYLNSRKVNIGPNATLALKNCGGSELDLLKFYNSALAFLEATMKKILERCPLKYKLTRAISCFSPLVISTSPKLAMDRMNILLQILLEKKKVLSTDVDQIQLQFESMVKNAAFTDSFKTFKFPSDALDEFYHRLIGSSDDSAYVELWALIRRILILSHGNAAVESGFSINNDLLVENLQLESMVAQRLVYDSIKAAGGINSIDIDKQLILSFRGARSRYDDALQEKKTARQDEERERQKRKRAAAEIKELELKKQRVKEQNQLQVEALDKEIAQLSKHVKK